MDDRIKSIMGADQFLRSNGILTDTHKNNLVLVTLCACQILKNVAFDINEREKEIEAILYLGFWGYYFASKKKILNQLTTIYGEYLPEYNIRIVFKKYGRKKRQSRSTK